MKYLQKILKRVDIRTTAGFFAVKLRAFGFTRQKLPSCIALVVCPMITFYLFDAYTHNPLTEMNFKTQLLNIVFYELTGFFLFGLLKYVRLALMLQSGLFMIIGLVNYYVLNFRSAPIMPWKRRLWRFWYPFWYCLWWKAVLPWWRPGQRQRGES